MRAIIEDPESSPNDKFVVYDLLKNACISAGGVLPMCQDTGNAIVMGKKGQRVWTGYDDAEAIAKGVWRSYGETNLRYSMVAPLETFKEANTGDNLPAQIDLYSTDGDEYEFLFVAKGGGSANKQFLFQDTPARLTEAGMLKFLDEKIKTLGTAACPPYHLAVVIGGTSAEMTMKTLKLATTKYLDGLPTQGNKFGQAFRDRDLEAKIHKLTQANGIGAQFGGKYFCHDVRVVRLPRHGASLPIAIGVSCSADRQALGKITKRGRVSRTARDRSREVPARDRRLEAGRRRRSRSTSTSRCPRSAQSCRAYPVTTRVMLTGTLIVARDLAHAKLRTELEAGKPLPDYFKNHPIYYAGPAKTPTGYASGAFGPTTAGRMDSFVDQFQAAGGSMVMVAKGNRSKPRRHRRVQEARRLLSVLDRRRRRPAGRELHQEGRVHRLSRDGHGSDLAHRGRGFPVLHRRRRQGQRLLRQVDGVNRHPPETTQWHAEPEGAAFDTSEWNERVAYMYAYWRRIRPAPDLLPGRRHFRSDRRAESPCIRLDAGRAARAIPPQVPADRHEHRAHDRRRFHRTLVRRGAPQSPQIHAQARTLPADGRDGPRHLAARSSGPRGRSLLENVRERDDAHGE